MKQAAFAIAICVFIFSLGLLSCQKELNPFGNTTPPPVDTTDTEPQVSDIVKDSAVLISKDIYLWYNQIPDTFNGRHYSDPNAIMYGLRKFSKEPGFTAPVDRFSFAETKAEWDNVSSGVQKDFGMSVFFNNATDLRVKYTEAASPSGATGIKRGWRIMAINGNTAIDTSDATIDRIIDAVFYSSSTAFTFEKPDGSLVNITLNAASYQTNPVFADSVYTLTNGKVVGYLAFNSFLGNTTQITNKFNAAFGKFSSANVTDMIVDLRYNGGGYVSLQEALANYLVPSAGNGQVMYTESFNDKYSSYNKTVNFSKKGSVNVSRIFFIVSHSTASASELLINSLKPFVTEQLVGPSTTTYGKPVGFFNIGVGDWYIFPVSFRTVNKNNEGSYFNGFTVNYPTRDGVDKNWGDIQENCLARVLNYIQTGSYARRRTEFTSEERRVAITNEHLSPKTFNVMVDTRKIK